MTEKKQVKDFLASLENVIESEVPQEEEPQNRQKIKKGFYHENIFGQGDTGFLSQRKILPEDIGNIPGLIRLWTSDLERRQQGIQDWKERGLVERMSSLVASRSSDHHIMEVTGEELMIHHPSKPVYALVRILKKNPRDSASRLRLVYEVKKSNRELSLNVYRSFVMQAATALSFCEFTPAGLQITIWAYGAYLSKLLRVIHEKQMELEKKMSPFISGTSAHKESLQTLSQALNVNKKIVQNYKEYLEQNADPKQIIRTTFVLDDTADLGPNARKNTENLLLFKALKVVNILRAIPILHPTAHKVAQKMIQHYKYNSLAYLMEARIFSSEMRFAVKRYESGDYSKANREQIKEAFKQAHHFYGWGTKKLGTLPQKKDIPILFEYANNIYQFYLICRDIIFFFAGNEWFAALLGKAYRTVSLLLTIDELSKNERKDAEQLQRKLLNHLESLGEGEEDKSTLSLQDKSWEGLDQALQNKIKPQ
ncbi:MAG: hypothetical protein HQM13_01005 [SAR324 cluster bacterium]|nr:hypothetical protein [SAR324 cluster bacterium]